MKGLMVAVALACIVAAAMAFLRTPPEERYRVLSPQPDKDNDSEYAEECTRAERIRTLIIGLAVGLPFFAIVQFWAFPALAQFSRTAQCHEWLGADGDVWLLYGVFVGSPLLAVLVAGVPSAWLGYKMIRERRSPPQGVKVYRRTKIKRGRRAVLIGIAYQLPLLCVIGLTLWAVPLAHGLVAQHDRSKVDYSVCTRR